MDQNVPYRRPRAIAVAFSETIEARRQALMMRVSVALVAILLAVEALSIARSLVLSQS